MLMFIPIGLLHKIANGQYSYLETVSFKTHKNIFDHKNDNFLLGTMILNTVCQINSLNKTENTLKKTYTGLTSMPQGSQIYFS